MTTTTRQKIQAALGAAATNYALYYRLCPFDETGCNSWYLAYRVPGRNEFYVPLGYTAEQAIETAKAMAREHVRPQRTW